jgi:hypothetical protein
MKKLLGILMIPRRWRLVTAEVIRTAKPTL